MARLRSFRPVIVALTLTVVGVPGIRLVDQPARAQDDGNGDESRIQKGLQSLPFRSI